MSARFTGSVCVVLLLAAAAAAPVRGQPKIITISETGVFPSPSRPAVRFTHADHMSIEGVSCLTCHHVFVNAKNVLDPKDIKEGDSRLRCAACHATQASLERSFHLQCISCHDAAKRTGQVTGPRECGQCHAGGR
jgi:hypothetical protein